MADFRAVNFRAMIEDRIASATQQDQLASAPEGGTPMTSRAKTGSTGYPSALGITDVFLNLGLTTSTAVAQENMRANILPLLQTSVAKAATAKKNDVKDMYQDVWARYVDPDVLKSLEDMTDEQFQKIFRPNDPLPGDSKPKSQNGSTSESPSTPGSGTGSSGGAANTTTETGVPAQIWNYLAGKGLSPYAIAAIMGALQSESGLNPEVTEVGSGIGFGLAQWSYGRRTALESYAESVGKSPADLYVQLDYLWEELNGAYRGVLDILQSNASLSDMSYAMLTQFERPREDLWASRAVKDLEQAQYWYDTFNVP